MLFRSIAGGLYTINFEIVTAEVVGAHRSGAYLLFTFLGGALFFFGPIIGAVLMVLATVLLSELTKAWLLYLGLFFIVIVMYAPGGIASLIMMNLRLVSAGLFARVLPSTLRLMAAALVALLGLVSLIEMTYHASLESSQGPMMKLFSLQIDTSAATPWLFAFFLLGAGVALLLWWRKAFSDVWDEVQAEMARLDARSGR